jgi:NHL repeat
MQELDPNGAFIRRWGDHVKFQLQTDPAVDSAGNMYVADTGHDEVQKWDPTLATHVAIGAGVLAAPQGVAVDPAGNLYAADTGNGRIVKFDPAGNVVASWGGFNQPADVEFWASVVYVTETGANRVDELTPDGTPIAHFGGLNQPQGLGVDAQGNVDVADAGNARVVRFGPTGTFLDAWGAYGHGDGEFVAPADVVIGASSDAYVSDTFNNRLERFALGPSTPPPAPAPPAPAPKRRPAAPRLTLRIARHQRVLRQGGVKVAVSCVSNCRTVVTAKGLRTLTLTLHAKHVAHRKLALTKATKKRIKTALSRHRHPTILVTATAKAPAGPSGTSKRKIRITVTG